MGQGQGCGRPRAGTRLVYSQAETAYHTFPPSEANSHKCGKRNTIQKLRKEKKNIKQTSKDNNEKTRERRERQEAREREGGRELGREREIEVEGQGNGCLRARVIAHKE